MPQTSCHISPVGPCYYRLGGPSSQSPRGLSPAEASHMSCPGTEPVKPGKAVDAGKMAEMPETVELGEAVRPMEAGEPAPTPVRPVVIPRPSAGVVANCRRHAAVICSNGIA